jgi:hypothetical protein
LAGGTTVSSGSLNSAVSASATFRVSVPGIRRTLSSASAEPGITLERKPPFMMTGAMVVRMSEWISGSFDSCRSAAARADGVPLNRSL